MVPWRQYVKLVAIAAIQGMVIGLCLGASVWLFLGVSVETPMVPRPPDSMRADFALSRLLLPFPDPFRGKCTQ